MFLPPQTGSVVPLETLDLTKIHQSVGVARRDAAHGGKALTVGGKTYERGIGTHAESYFRLRLGGKARRFRAMVGLDDGGERYWGTGVRFWLEGDGRILAQSPSLRRGSAAVPLEADLSGVKTLTLVAVASGFGVKGDDADWIAPEIEMVSGLPKVQAVPIEKPTIVSPRPDARPRFTGAKLFGVRPGHPIVHSITATGSRPLTFSARELPLGVTLDATTGVLGGRVAEAGTYEIPVVAENANGRAVRRFRLVVGEAIALTPPMGWNSWNSFDWRVTQAQVEGAAGIVHERLRDHGWLYVNVDDAWQYGRGGPFNAIQPNRKFPDMKGMVDRIHGLGLKAGIYSSPWMETYAGHVGGTAEDAQGTYDWLAKGDDTGQNGGGGKFQRIGPYSFVANDTQQYAAWGFDYLKYDWNPIDPSHTKEAFDLMRASGRDIVFSLSNGARLDDAPELAKLSQLWRTSGDMSDTWGAIRQNAFDKAAWAPFQGPGHWSDEDMLVVGRVSVGEELHPTRLTPNEQTLHITQWCLLGCPLLIGCDLSALDPFTLSLLTNDEVLDIDQDPLGRMATPVRQEATRQVWSKPLEDGSIAVGLYNLGEEPQSIRIDWKELGLAPGRYGVRDVWRARNVARSDKGYTARVPRHGAVLVRIFERR